MLLVFEEFALFYECELGVPVIQSLTKLHACKWRYGMAKQ